MKYLSAFQEDIAKFLGHPPFDGPENVYRADSYFAKELEKKYSQPISKLVQTFKSGKKSPPL